MSGIACVRQLRELLPDARIVMLTVFADREHIFQALKAGASGYLSKRTAPADLLKAIEEVHRGGAPLSGDIAARIVEYFKQKGTEPPLPDNNLTPREQEILEQLAQGFLYKEITDGAVRLAGAGTRTKPARSTGASQPMAQGPPSRWWRRSNQDTARARRLRQYPRTVRRSLR